MGPHGALGPMAPWEPPGTALKGKLHWSGLGLAHGGPCLHLSTGQATPVLEASSTASSSNMPGLSTPPTCQTCPAGRILFHLFCCIFQNCLQRAPRVPGGSGGSIFQHFVLFPFIFRLFLAALGGHPGWALGGPGAGACLLPAPPT